MITTTINKAKLDFENIMKTTTENSEETIVVSDEGSVVIIEQGEWESLHETLNILKDK